MDNVRFETVENPNETTTEIAIIEHADGSFTSMLKSTYEAQQVEQSRPNLSPIE
jgi:hypothetical protein